MLSIRLTKCVWTHAENVVAGERMVDGQEIDVEPKFAILERKLSLPFAPFPGLRLSGEGWESGALQTVEWSTTDELFRCTVEDEFPRNAYGSELTFEYLFSSAIREGWHRPEVGGRTAPW